MASDPVFDTDGTVLLPAVDAMFDEVAGHLNALHGRLVRSAVWMLDHVDAWQGDGVWTPEQYLALRLGVAPGVAKKIVDVARRASEFPDCVAALKRGELSLDQVAPIVRNAPGWCDRQMAGLAPRCTAAQVSKIARKYQWDHAARITAEQADKVEAGNVETSADEPGTEEVEPVVEESADSCWWGYDDAGRFRLWLETDQERGDLIEAALAEASDALFRTTGTPPSGVDAVAELADRSLDTIKSPSRRNRYRINVHIDTNGTATDSRGRAVPTSIAQHISCNGIVAPVFIDNGLPVSVGRSQHIVPDRTRRIVEHRDGGCRVPGCTSDRFVEVHHIIHWSKHGVTDTWNLICLCPAHHRLHHRGRLGITGNADNADGVVFTDQHGRNLLDRCARPQPSGQPPAPINGTYRRPLGERLNMSWLHFNDDPNRPTRLRPPTER